MGEHLVDVGPLQVLLPPFATKESVEKEATGLTSLVVVLGPMVLTLWHADDRLDNREPFLARIMAQSRPERHERTTFVLGGCRFDGVRMMGCARFGPTSDMLVGTADFFGDFVALSRLYRAIPSDAESVDALLDSIVQGIVVRRQRTLSPDRLRAWMGRQPG
jgi:hypothetical protein